MDEKDAEAKKVEEAAADNKPLPMPTIEPPKEEPAPISDSESESEKAAEKRGYNELERAILEQAGYIARGFWFAKNNKAPKKEEIDRVLSSSPTVAIVKKLDIIDSKVTSALNAVTSINKTLSMQFELQKKRSDELTLRKKEDEIENKKRDEKEKESEKLSLTPTGLGLGILFLPAFLAFQRFFAETREKITDFLKYIVFKGPLKIIGDAISSLTGAISKSAGDLKALGESITKNATDLFEKIKVVAEKIRTPLSNLAGRAGEAASRAADRARRTVGRMGERLPPLPESVSRIGTAAGDLFKEDRALGYAIQKATALAQTGKAMAAEAFSKTTQNSIRMLKQIAAGLGSAKDFIYKGFAAAQKYAFIILKMTGIVGATKIMGKLVSSRLLALFLMASEALVASLEYGAGKATGAEVRRAWVKFAASIIGLIIGELIGSAVGKITGTVVGGLLGAFIGGLLGGPPGAIAGAGTGATIGAAVLGIIGGTGGGLIGMEIGEWIASAIDEVVFEGKNASEAYRNIMAYLIYKKGGVTQQQAETQANALTIAAFSPITPDQEKIATSLSLGAGLSAGLIGDYSGTSASDVQEYYRSSVRTALSNRFLEASPEEQSQILGRAGISGGINWNNLSGRPGGAETPGYGISNLIPTPAPSMAPVSPTTGPPAAAPVTSPFNMGPQRPYSHQSTRTSSPAPLPSFGTFGRGGSVSGIPNPAAEDRLLDALVAAFNRD